MDGFGIVYMVDVKSCCVLQIDIFGGEFLDFLFFGPIGVEGVAVEGTLFVVGVSFGDGSE